jgi:hypothetical protein
MHRRRKERAEKADKHTPPKPTRKKINTRFKAFVTAWTGFHDLGVKLDDLDELRAILTPYFPVMPTNALAMAVDAELERGIIAVDDGDDQSPKSITERRQLLKTWYTICDAMISVGVKRDDVLKCRAILGRYVIPLAAVLGYYTEPGEADEELNTEQQEKLFSVQSSDS